MCQTTQLPKVNEDPKSPINVNQSKTTQLYSISGGKQAGAELSQAQAGFPAKH